ncbi:hypothetical protein QY97_01028 [Bacillus thermotolerans]|uniref:Uncharacterized protein n=1 Tax=Bacillus thermotolerans TaxID=1221996 RepID=A0A0F5ICK5_BACTR|nr:hypothetical protein QY97_01028 [Bacillus thermotolerans]KKB43188.1 hypothetical protein QY95_02174 [Bacillus thermotolerans]KKB43591.1 hypothetical protein QY96_00828 [Bacillus thermotolerans]
MAKGNMDVSRSYHFATSLSQEKGEAAALSLFFFLIYSHYPFSAQP